MSWATSAVWIAGLVAIVLCFFIYRKTGGRWPE